VIQVVTLEALCDLWFLKTCPIIHLAAHLPAEGDLLLRRENLIADDEQSVDRPKPSTAGEKGCRHGQGGADDFRPICGDTGWVTTPMDLDFPIPP
jgi:hypothetical protein